MKFWKLLPSQIHRIIALFNLNLLYSIYKQGWKHSQKNGRSKQLNPLYAYLYPCYTGL